MNIKNDGYNKMDILKTFKKGKGAQLKSFEEADNKHNKFFFVYQQKLGKNYTNTYSSCKDHQEFLDFEESIPEEKRRFYELIREDHACPEYYDLDFKMKDWEGETKHQKINNVLSEFLNIRNEFSYYNIHHNMTFKLSDLVVLESCGLDLQKDKLSLHIIIRPELNSRAEKYFSSTKQQKKIQSEFNVFLKKQDTKITLDMSVYSNNSLMRLSNSHKKDEVHRKFKPFGNTKNLQDKRLLFCSFVNEKPVCPITIIEEEKFNTPITDFQNEASDEDILKLFNHLDYSRWDDRQTCISLIWLAKKLKISEFEIHNFCARSDKYCQDWVTSIINQGREDCAFSIGTLYYFLKQDVDNETLISLFPKKDSFEEILAIPQKKRTKEQQLFLDRISKQMTQKNIKELTVTEGFIERKNEKYVLTRDINKGKITVVKAGLGKGKTTATVEHVNNFEYDCIIILTPRRSYAKTTLSRVNSEIKLPDDKKFELYSELKGSIRDKYIIIQVESLCRLLVDFEGYNTLVILDEVESLLYQMTSHKTHGPNHLQNLEMFERLLTESDKVLCMDAFISNKTLSVLKNIGKDYTYYNYTKKLENRKAIELPKKNILKNKIIQSLKQGKKSYFYCSSRKQLTEYFLADIKAQFPNKNIIEYHSKKNSIDLTTINEEWAKADLIVATCTITVGCNFDIPDLFHNIFVYASACSRNLIRDIFQSTYRVRHIIDKTLYYCLDTRHNGINVPTNISEIKETIENKTKFHKAHYEKFLKMDFTSTTPTWIKDLLINNIFESNMSVMNLKSLFNKYLDLCNYSLEDEDEDELNDLDIEDEKSGLVFEDYHYTDIPEITFSQRQELLKKKKREPLSDLDEFTLNKNFFQATLIVEGRSNIMKEDEISLWNVYCNFGKKKFRNLSYEKGLNDGTLRICDIISSSFPEIADNLSRKLEDILEITQKLGLKNSQDFSSIQRDIIVNNLGWLEKNSARFHSNFGLRNRSKGGFTLRNGSELLNKIFNSWGFSKFTKGKAKTTKVNGKNIDLTDFTCKNTEEVEVYKYLEGKTVKQTEKKVKILKEGEDPMNL